MNYINRAPVRSGFLLDLVSGVPQKIQGREVTKVGYLFSQPDSLGHLID